MWGDLVLILPEHKLFYHIPSRYTHGFSWLQTWRIASEMLAKVENPNWEIQDNSQGNKLVTVVQQSPIDGGSLEKMKA